MHVVYDDSTFRSEEISAKQWLYDDCTPFYSKARGKSIMMSDFLAMHESSPFCQLNPAEYEKAFRKIS